MKLAVLPQTKSLCEQCVALCCRYYAFAIDKPETHRDFEDMRWYLLHEDTIIFVEEGEWYIQVNRPCRELLPDNRCGIYENRPTICREYTTEACDWHGDEYDYEHLFTEPDQLQRFAKEYLAKKRKRRAARNGSKNGSKEGSKHGSKNGSKNESKSGKGKKVGNARLTRQAGKKLGVPLDMIKPK